MMGERVEAAVDEALRDYARRLDEAALALSQECTRIAHLLFRRHLIPAMPRHLRWALIDSLTGGKVREGIARAAQVHPADLAKCESPEGISDLYEVTLNRCLASIRRALPDFGYAAVEIPGPRRQCEPGVMSRVCALVGI